MPSAWSHIPKPTPIIPEGTATGVKRTVPVTPVITPEEENNDARII